MTDITNQQLLDGVNESIQGLIDIVATKEDLKNYPTKDDLKEELKAFATKDDLKAYPTKEDVREIVREEVADIRDAQLAQGARLEVIEDKIEEMDDKITKIAEAVNTDLSLKKSIKDHESRINDLEVSKRLVVSTVRDHTAQLKTLRQQKT